MSSSELSLNALQHISIPGGLQWRYFISILLACLRKNFPLFFPYAQKQTQLAMTTNIDHQALPSPPVSPSLANPPMPRRLSHHFTHHQQQPQPLLRVGGSTVLQDAPTVAHLNPDLPKPKKPCPRCWQQQLLTEQKWAALDGPFGNNTNSN